MPTYVYRARTKEGKLIRGSMDGPHEDNVTAKLRQQGHMPTQIQLAASDVTMESFFNKFRRVRVEDMMIWNFQLSNLINAGISLLMSLQLVADQTENKKLREVTRMISRDVDAGNSFSQALSRHKRIFPTLFVSMVRAGESSGKLDDVLINYAEYIEQQHEIRQKVLGALYYPLILLFAGTGVMTYVVSVIIPQFVEIFVEAGVALPLPTVVVYKAGLFIKGNWIFIAAALILTFVIFKFYISTEKGRLRFDRFKLRLPAIGPLIRKLSVSRFTRTLGILFHSGVPILESMETTLGVAGNAVIDAAIRRARSGIEKGERISDALKRSQEFPKDAIQMMSSGEESGTMDAMLRKISDFYDKSLGYAIKKVTTLIEPILLMIMGGMVGLIMLSTLLPMLDMIAVLR